MVGAPGDPGMALRADRGAGILESVALEVVAVVALGLLAADVRLPHGGGDAATPLDVEPAKSAIAVAVGLLRPVFLPRRVSRTSAGMFSVMPQNRQASAKVSSCFRPSRNLCQAEPPNSPCRNFS